MSLALSSRPSLCLCARTVLAYFSICGRGEVARLIAAAGELEFTDNALDPSFDATGGWNQELKYKEMGAALGFPGVLPILEHGDLKIYQTTAIESYLANISPKYAGLTPAQNLAALGAIIVAYRLLGFLALRRRFRPRGW